MRCTLIQRKQSIPVLSYQPRNTCKSIIATDSMLLTSSTHIGHMLLQQAQSLLPLCQQLSPASSTLFRHLYMQLSPQRSHWSCPSSSSMATSQQSSRPPCNSRSITSNNVQPQQQEDKEHSEQPQQSSIMYVLPMPSLSHTMTSGRITKWLKAPGDSVSIYDIVAEVTTDDLVEEAYKVDDFAGSVTLLLESQEEAHLGAVLVPEGQEVPIGTPIAVLCEDEDAAAAAAAVEAAQQLAGLNVYDEQQMQQKQRQGWQLLEWQSYLKESNKDSCGCM